MFFYNCSFIAERAFPLEIKGAGINVSFFICRGDKSIIILCVY